MPKYFYHGTTLEGYHAIQADGYIRPSSGNTYKNKIFLANNDSYARRVTFVKHAQTQGETIVVYKIPNHVLKKKFLSDGSKHISAMLSLGDKTWCYNKPIKLTNDILVGSEPYFLNLPTGVSIHRDGKASGFSFTAEAAQQWGIDADLAGVVIA